MRVIVLVGGIETRKGTEWETVVGVYDRSPDVTDAMERFRKRHDGKRTYFKEYGCEVGEDFSLETSQGEGVYTVDGVGVGLGRTPERDAG